MQEVKTDLRKIPGVGEKTEQSLRRLGYHSIQDLKGQNPEEMYQRDCALNKLQIDRCQLYVYRLAVYFANHESHDPEKLKWWNWKDR